MIWELDCAAVANDERHGIFPMPVRPVVVRLPPCYVGPVAGATRPPPVGIGDIARNLEVFSVTRVVRQQILEGDLLGIVQEVIGE